LSDIIFRNSVTYLENLPNEIFYEIFDYLDDYHIYDGFFHLNKRFQDISTHPNVPININISSLSKSKFEEYYRDFINPNKDRINSINLTHPFIVDIMFSLNDHIKTFPQLEQLILDSIEPKYLENLLPHLLDLPNLYSLSIPLGDGSNPSLLYNLIFDLPRLKHCKITFKNEFQYGQIPISVNKSSPIKYRTFIDTFHLTEVLIFLSYVPQLCHLSVNYIHQGYSTNVDNLSLVLNNLTHLSLECERLYFAHFVIFIKTLSAPIQVLHMTTTDDPSYLDANRWEQFILSDMTHLEIFDFQYSDQMCHGYRHESRNQSVCNKFTSSFWLARQWFFRYDPNCGGEFEGIFYSIQPYR
jgi:hypothetical protein